MFVFLLEGVIVEGKEQTLEEAERGAGKGTPQALKKSCHGDFYGSQ